MTPSVSDRRGVRRRHWFFRVVLSHIGFPRADLRVRLRIAASTLSHFSMWVLCSLFFRFPTAAQSSRPPFAHTSWAHFSRENRHVWALLRVGSQGSSVPAEWGILKVTVLIRDCLDRTAFDFSSVTLGIPVDSNVGGCARPGTFLRLLFRLLEASVLFVVFGFSVHAPCMAETRWRDRTEPRPRRG